MNVYITKLNGLPLQDTSQYIQRMTAEIAHQLGCREMGIYRYNGANESSDSLNGRLDGIIAGIEWGEDVVICQFPTGNGLKYERELINRLKMYQARVVIFIHDSAHLVKEANRASLEETVRLYNRADVLIVPSLAMRQFLLDNGIKKDMKFIIQEMWDYLTFQDFSSSPQFYKEIHFADDSRFEGMDDWNYKFPLKLYDTSANQRKNVCNTGKLLPGELLYALSKGGFGLVWYQDEDSRKEMEYGTSFFLARYLAAGIPVIVPAGILNQTLIENNHLGLIVNSLDEAVNVVGNMADSDYQKYVECVRQFAPALRNGYYTKKCLIDALQAVFRKDVGEIAIPENIYNLGEPRFTYTVLKESYEGNLALSWSYHGEADGFLIYDAFDKLIYETRNMHQHYFLLKGYQKENGFIVKAYVDTCKGKLVVAESEPNYMQAERYDHARVSIIIPAYNSEDYIIRSIDTALAQSLSDLELILVDDGSTDCTPNIIEWYARRYSNVTVIHRENGGVAAARNTGIESAKGEYIGFMDNDDMICPEMMSRLYGSAKKNDCDIAITSIYVIKNGEYETAVQYELKEDNVVSAAEFFNMHFEKDIIFSVMIWNRIYRASLIRKSLLLPEIIGDDDAWSPYIISYADRICYIDDCSYEYDRTIRSDTLLDEWKKSSKKERFFDFKKIVLFFLENGNPKQRKQLKEYARRYLRGLKIAYQYDEYEKLWNQIEVTF